MSFLLRYFLYFLAVFALLVGVLHCPMVHAIGHAEDDIESNESHEEEIVEAVAGESARRLIKRRPKPWGGCSERETALRPPYAFAPRVRLDCWRAPQRC
ncbi:MAG: hypothetical protein JKY65_24140 [Planctomycetes bacterium]|nr:hypothetical protein [Planctomycetota bacterium]